MEIIDKSRLSFLALENDRIRSQKYQTFNMAAKMSRGYIYKNIKTQIDCINSRLSCALFEFSIQFFMKKRLPPSLFLSSSALKLERVLKFRPIFNFLGKL